MQHPAIVLPRRRLRVAGILLAALAAGFFLRAPLSRVLALILGAALLCFLAAPLAALYERRLSRPAASLLSLLTFALVAALLLWLALPRMLRDMMELTRTLPEAIGTLSRWAEDVRSRLEARLPGIALPGLDWSALQGTLAGIAGGTISFAVNLADLAGRASMMAVLACFFLRDRERMLLRLELLLPQSMRHTAVRMGNAVCRELRVYLRGQLMIAAAVGLLSTAALAVVGVRSALLLGPFIGLMNMIPYFGPFIGGVPAVIIALADGWQRAALTVAALALVQQLDGTLISPRIMGSLTGFSPSLVLVGIFAGAQLGGIAGMLFALPVMLSIRTLFRVFVQKCEII